MRPNAGFPYVYGFPHGSGPYLIEFPLGTTLSEVWKFPPVAAASAVPSAKNLVAHVAIQVPWTVLQAMAAAGNATPPVAAPNTNPADE